MAVSQVPNEALPIRIKGTQDGLVVTVAETLDERWLLVLEGEFVAAPDFWRGGRVVLAVGARAIERDELAGALMLLERYGMRLWAVLSDSESTRRAARELSLAVRLPGARIELGERPPERAAPPRARLHAVPAAPSFLREEAVEPDASRAEAGEPGFLRQEPGEPGFLRQEPVEPASPLEPAAGPGPGARRAELGPETAYPRPTAVPAAREALADGDDDEDEVDEHDEGPRLPPLLVLRETLRSGRSVRHPGAVFVLGDVNPGAEILAEGDVVVWGKLRGLVHAGAGGDPSAVVCALDLNPTQLRIADKITVPPKDSRRQPVPEMAVIRDGLIVAESWRSKP